MLVLVTLFVLCTLGASVNESNECIFERLNDGDLEFCRGGLEITYPGLDASCNVIPNCGDYRQSLMSVWGPPAVKFPDARLDKKYVLIMVDPDAPNRVDHTYRFWRHWLLTGIQGPDLVKGGDLRGKILSDYRRPNPPQGSGYHRYQIFIYEQPEGEEIKMTEKERGTYGSWDMNMFVESFRLGFPKATGQFIVAKL